MAKYWGLLLFFCLLAGCGFQIESIDKPQFQTVAIINQTDDRRIESSIVKELIYHGIIIQESERKLIIRESSCKPHLQNVASVQQMRLCRIFCSIEFSLIRDKKMQTDYAIEIFKDIILMPQEILINSPKQNLAINELHNRLAQITIKIMQNYFV